MKCPHCNKDIKEEMILSEAARISGRRSRRTLTTEDARTLALKMHAARREKEKIGGNKDK